MPNYFEIFINESLDNFKDVFAKMDAPFKGILNLISNFTDNLEFRISVMYKLINKLYIYKRSFLYEFSMQRRRLPR